jgi:Winged helix DNA-binding domain
MRPSDVQHVRLHSQRLSFTRFTRPDEVVSWLGAVQAQDYSAAKWAVGQHMRQATDQIIEKAFAEGSILRTHVLRPTWHLVAPADIRWMLELTAPRVRGAIGFNCRRMSMDEALFKRSQKALIAALRGGRQLTRDALRQVIQRAGIATDGVRLVLILMRAELDGVICSGARIGKQFTYALLDERVPRSNALTRDEALAELTRRYFTSRGPATVKDFVWWSGLTAADARAGIEMTGRRLVREVIDGKTCWRSSSAQAVIRRTRAVYFLPAYDE